jgi:two-component system chemotaxis sensor kinase CheA
MAFTLGEYQDVFLEEADDQLQELNKNLLDLEQNPDNEETINNIFRAAHSLKSSAAFVGLNDLSELAHKMENLLQGIRDKTMTITPEIIEILFRCFDVINAVIDEVSQGEKPTEDLSGVIEDIVNIGIKAKESSASVQPSAVKSSVVEKTVFNAQEKKHLKKGIDQGMSCFEITAFIEPEAPMKWVKAQLIMNNAKNIGQIIKTIPPEEDLSDDKIGRAFKIVLLSTGSMDAVRKICNVDLITRVDISKVTLTQKDDKFVLKFGDVQTVEEPKEIPVEVKPAVVASAPVVVVAPKAEMVIEHDDDHEDDIDPRAVRRTLSADKKGGTNAPTLRTVKVSVEKLDELLNTVGELVISNSGFYRLYEDLKSQNAEKSVINEFKNRMEQMSRIAKDLQSGIMKTRMVPIGQVFTRFNRLVRDLAKECGKQVQLNTKGEDTELDKKVIDVIGEPLMHLVRNSIDHGIEMPDERVNQKKPELGTVTLDAYQSGNQILVEVSDDGRGLNIVKIKKKALEQGLATVEMLANMDESDVYEFIFHPGFSTADRITEVSGRGVGMNVVREVVNEMNGSIAIESEPGMGTRFVMSFPLTLAIIPAIMVKVRKEMYAVPLSDVIETIKISSTDITTIEGHEVINLRGEILSLLRLNQFVCIESSLVDQTKIPVVVVGFGNRKIGLIVDELEGKQEIVIKSLEQNYTTVSGLAGASILGDGSICLILDISSMISRVISEQEKISRDQKRKVLDREATVEKIIQKPAVVKESQRKDIEPQKEKTVLKAEEAAPPRQERLSPPEDDAGKKRLQARTTSAPAAQKPTVSAPAVKIEAQKDPESPKVVQTVKAPDPVTVPAAPAAPEGETTPVADAKKNDVVDEKVREALNSFKNELETNISSSLGGRPDDHIKRSLSISDQDLRKIQVLANVGITHGAESLSRIINKRVDLAIPEVKLLPIEKVPDVLAGRDEPCIGVYMPIVGDITGTVLLSLPEVSAFELVDSLFGLETGETKALSEDGESALKEITNIVGSSVVNAISEKTGLSIMPDVPVIQRDFLQAIIDGILVSYNVVNDYALIMDTEFYYQDDRVMGNLLILPDTASLSGLVEHLKDN